MQIDHFFLIDSRWKRAKERRVKAKKESNYAPSV